MRLAKSAPVLLALSVTLYTAGCSSDESGTGDDDSGGENGGDASDDVASGEDAATGEVVEIPDDVTEDMTFTAGTYIVPHDFRVHATLTIEPCVVIEGHNRIYVENGGVIEAAGDEDCPVTFTSSADTPAPGDWRSLEIKSTAGGESSFEHVVFEYGGRDDHEVVKVAADASFRDTTIRHADASGISQTDGTISELTDMTFESLAGHPMRIAIDDIDAIDGVATADVENETIFVAGSTLSEPATWAPQSIPYELFGSSTNFHIEDELTIQAGTTVLISTGNVRGFIQDGGSLQVEGTEDAPVVIESVEETPAPGDWRNLRFYDSAEPSSFRWTTIRHGGSSSQGGALYAEAEVELENVTFEENDGCDVRDAGEFVTADDSSSYRPC